jgi:hypothetical protein
MSIESPKDVTEITALINEGRVILAGI